MAFIFCLGNTKYGILKIDDDWMNSIMAISCTLFTRYRNPCLMEYFWVVVYFGYYLVFFMGYMCYSRALKYSSFYQEPFFPSLIGSIQLKSKTGGLPLGLMAVGIFVDFFVVKSDVKALFKPRRIPELPVGFSMPLKTAKKSTRCSRFHRPFLARNKLLRWL